jgi:hypothetical protein
VSLPKPTADSNYFSIAYTKVLAATDLTYTVKESSDLASWVTATPVNEVMADNGIT